jgi:mRNA-degrading endonuclease RelE of RelBE toxin-antitoxin system
MIKSRELVFITGKTGSGKSVLFRKMLTDKKRLIIFDTISEYRELSPPYPALFVHDIGQLYDYFAKNHSGAFRVIFDPEDPEAVLTLKDGSEVTVFEEAAKLIYTHLDSLIIGIEEISNFMTGSRTPEFLRKITRFGRHSALSLYSTTQRPADVHPLIRAQITKLISFKQHEPRDIDWLKQVIGEEAQGLKDLAPFVWGKPMVKGVHYREYDL